MSLPTTTRVNRSIERRLVFLGVLIWPILAMADDWKIDFSRRFKDAPQSAELSTEPQQDEKKSEPGFIERLFQPGEPVQELVILNTEKGFLPSTVRVRQGWPYRIHVVNVNEKEKNVSFVLDAFSEHHATFYGKIKTFEIRPQKDGVFKFISPETSAQGRVVVYPSTTANPPELRAPASEE